MEEATIHIIRAFLREDISVCWCVTWVAGVGCPSLFP